MSCISSFKYKPINNGEDSFIFTYNGLIERKKHSIIIYKKY